MPFRLHLSRRRAVAAAALGGTEAVDFVLTDTGNRFEVVATGTVDALISNSTWTLRRDVSLGLNWVGVLYCDGQGVLAHRSPGAISLAQVGAASGTTMAPGVNRRHHCRNTDRVVDPIEHKR